MFVLLIITTEKGCNIDLCHNISRIVPSVPSYYLVHIVLLVFGITKLPNYRPTKSLVFARNMNGTNVDRRLEL